jgi:hypothetical protein
MEPKVTTVKLKDDSNTVIFCNPTDDPAKVKQFYECKLKECYSAREEANNHFTETYRKDSE